MLAEQRFEVIVQELDERRAASVTQLCAVTGSATAVSDGLATGEQVLALFHRF